MALNTRLKFRWDAPADRDSIGTLTNPAAHLLRLIEQISSGLHEKQFVLGMPQADGTPGLWVTNSWAYNYCYVVPVEMKTANLSIQVGYFDEHDDGFYCFIEPHRSTVWHWFKRIDVEACVTELQKSIDDILKSDKLVNSMKWSTFEDYDTVDL